MWQAALFQKKRPCLTFPQNDTTPHDQRDITASSSKHEIHNENCWPDPRGIPVTFEGEFLTKWIFFFKTEMIPPALHGTLFPGHLSFPVSSNGEHRGGQWFLRRRRVKYPSTAKRNRSRKPRSTGIDSGVRGGNHSRARTSPKPGGNREQAIIPRRIGKVKSTPRFLAMEKFLDRRVVSWHSPPQLYQTAEKHQPGEKPILA